MVTAQHNGNIDAIDFEQSNKAAASSLPTDPALMQASVLRALDEFFMRVRMGGPAQPSPELLHLLREAAAVIAHDDPRWRAKLSLLAGLIHEFSRDVGGAEACYAEAGAANPSILKHGVLANIRTMGIRRREKKTMATSGPAEELSTGRTALAPRPRSRRPREPALPGSKAGARGRARAG